MVWGNLKGEVCSEGWAGSGWGGVQWRGTAVAKVYALFYISAPEGWIQAVVCILFL